MFSFYCKKLLRCPATYAAALLFFASLVFSVSEYPNWIDPVSYWNPLFLYEVSMNLGVTIWFIPVVTVLPICFVRKELSRGGVWQLPLLRTSPSRFALGGLGAACLSGAIVTLLGVSLFFLVGFLRAGGTLIRNYTLMGDGGWPVGDFRSGRSYIEVAFIELTGLIGMSVIYPAAAYLISGFSDNQYLCAASPFLLYSLALYSFQRLAYYVDWRFIWLDPARLNPMANPFNTLRLALLYSLTFISAVMIVCAVLFCRQLKRRLNNG